MSSTPTGPVRVLLIVPCVRHPLGVQESHSCPSNPRNDFRDLLSHNVQAFVSKWKVLPQIVYIFSRCIKWAHSHPISAPPRPIHHPHPPSPAALMREYVRSLRKHGLSRFPRTAKPRKTVVEPP